MEFGVAKGHSLAQLRNLIPSEIKLYGFDSFQGLPDPWNGFPAGSFATSYRRELPNTELVVGRFEETIPEFTKWHRQNVSLMHLDCDLYSSTNAVLSGFSNQIGNGTIIIFDELFGYAGYEQHEYRAFTEFIDKTKKPFTVLGRWNAYRAAIQFQG